MSNLFAVRNKGNGQYYMGRHFGLTQSAEEAALWKRYNDALRYTDKVTKRNPSADVEVVAFKLESVPYTSPAERQVLSLVNSENPTPRDLAVALLKYFGRATYTTRVDAVARLIEKANPPAVPEEATTTSVPAIQTEEREVTVVTQPTVVS